MQRLSSDPSHRAADLAACRELLREGSKSFSAASMLLPKQVRDSATVLYAFCRVADDAVDLHQDAGAAVARLRGRLDDIYAGTPQAFATDRALVEVVFRHALPRTLLDALIEGFEWDAQGRRYATLAELEAYAARVAGSIGAMMAVLMGARAPATIARACDLGVAMQLTNIARDVGEDARAGRLYLPLDALRAAGIEPQCWLADPRISDALRGVIRDLLRRADALYAGVESGVAELAPACRPGINAARLIYAEIGRVVARSHYDSVSQRAVVGKSRKLRLILDAYLHDVASTSLDLAPPLPATRYLVEAVAASVTRSSVRDEELAPAFPWWRFRSQALWLIDLFERMERRERIDLRGASAQNFTAS